MNGDIKVDLGSGLAYAEDRLRAIFALDRDSLNWQERLKRHIRISSQEASSIKCIGMAHPIPIGEIYRPTRLQSHKSGRYHQITVAQLLNSNTDALIFAGPGRGKTVFLNWVYTDLLRKKSRLSIPLLFQLRSEEAVAVLVELTRRLAMGRKHLPLKGDRLLLLVDGYDEISERDRKKISETLLDFKALGVGSVILTCRSFYHVYKLAIPQYDIVNFDKFDATANVEAFSNALGVHIDTAGVLADLSSHGFADFASHPLMLTLICILKTGPLGVIPRNSIGLLRRSIETLTFRWDYSRGIRRDSEIPIDGEERVRCLMRVACKMKLPRTEEDIVVTAARQHLKLIQQSSVDVRAFLTEIAQWYGLLVPTEQGYWEFAHRTIHDFLAARFMVESQGFDPRTVATWGSREAYAASLLQDATQSLVYALSKQSDIHAFSECLYNGAPFDTLRIAKAVVDHYAAYAGSFEHSGSDARIVVSTEDDFFSLCSLDFLESLLIVGTRRRGRAADLVSAYSIAELVERTAAVRGPVLDAVQMCYRSDAFGFDVARKTGAKVFTLRDALARVLKLRN